MLLRDGEIDDDDVWQVSALVTKEGRTQLMFYVVVGCQTLMFFARRLPRMIPTRISYEEKERGKRRRERVFGIRRTICGRPPGRLASSTDPKFDRPTAGPRIQSQEKEGGHAPKKRKNPQRAKKGGGRYERFQKMAEINCERSRENEFDSLWDINYYTDAEYIREGRRSRPGVVGGWSFGKGGSRTICSLLR